MILRCSCFKGFVCILFLIVTEQRACCERPCLWRRDQNPNLTFPILTTVYKAFFSLSFPLAEFIFEFCIVWQKAQGVIWRLSHPKGASILIVTISRAKECCRVGAYNPKADTSSPKKDYRLQAVVNITLKCLSPGVVCNT